MPVDEKTIELALTSKMSDFEDAIQYYTALNKGLPILLTRNMKDYSGLTMSVMTPQEYCATMAVDE